MLYNWFRKQMGFCHSDGQEKSHRLYMMAPWEIVLIVVAVILVFGVGKLSQVGGAMGKSIREFRKEKDRPPDGTPRLTTRETPTENSSRESEEKPEEESKD